MSHALRKTDFLSSEVCHQVKTNRSAQLQELAWNFGYRNYIQFNHGFLVFNVCCCLRSMGVNIDLGLQQALNTENRWLNVIITQCLFLTIFPIFSSSFSLLYRDAIEINACCSCQSSVKVMSFEIYR